MRTLVVNQGALGDLLLSLPALRLIKKHLGDFTLAGDPERCLFFKAIGEVTSVFPANSAAFSQLFTGTIPPHLDYFDDIWWFTRRRGLVPTILMMPDSRLKARVIFTVDEGPGGTNCSAFQFQQVCNELNEKGADFGDFLMPLSYSMAMDEREGFDLSIHPGSGSAMKNLPLSMFMDVAARLLDNAPGMTCCFILGPAEGGMIEDVERFARGFDGRVQIAMGFDLGGLSNLLGRTRVFWGNDSGVSHLSAWCGARTYINFGPTNPELWAPVCRNVTVFRSKAPCSPCGESYRKCPEPVCLRQIDPHAAEGALLSALRR